MVNPRIRGLISVEAAEIADRAALFKLSSKQLGGMHGIVPSFMAKPHPGLPGTSGHIHISLVDPKTGKNLFARDEEDVDAEWKDIRLLSDLGRYL
jgi:glutamine synthetase